MNHPSLSEKEDDGGTSTTLPPPCSREELYGKVQDLCSHGYGPELYRDVVSVLNCASFACAKRLVQEQQEENCCVDEACGLIYFQKSTSMDVVVGYGHDDGPKYDKDDMAEGRMSGTVTVLEKIWSVYSDYVQFLNCVRNIFLSLDRMMLQGGIVVKEEGGAVGMDMDKGSGGARWDLWDVGMDCLFQHFAMLGETSSLVAASKSMDNHMTTVMMMMMTEEEEEKDTKDSSLATGGNVLKNEKHSILEMLKNNSRHE
jgi:hypothetical protein